MDWLHDAHNKAWSNSATKSHTQLRLLLRSEFGLLSQRGHDLPSVRGHLSNNHWVELNCWKCKNALKVSRVSNVCRCILAIWTAKPQKSRWIHFQMWCFCDCVCKCICIIQNNVYILYVRDLQEDTMLFQKHSIIFWEIYLDSVSNLLYCQLSRRLIKQ